MKIVKAIILSIVLALISSSKLREGKTCHSQEACEKNQYCANMEKKHGQTVGKCEKKHELNTFCLQDYMCLSGKCGVPAKQSCIEKK
jgi:hypothetical protein